MQEEAFDEVVYRAAADGNIGAVKSVLAAGFDVNDRFASHDENDADTMLCLASEHGHYDLVKLLLERGADPNLSDNEQFDIRPLMIVFDERAIDLLVASGAAIDYARRPRDDEAGGRETALMWKVKFLQINCVRALLKNGASFSLRDDDGKTALDMARQNLLSFPSYSVSKSIVDLLTAVENAGSWKAYVREPVVALLSLRYLCLAGRATPPPHLVRCFGAPPIPAAGEARTRSRRAANNIPLPDEVFEHILTFWNFAARGV